jgi:hypothetical protein
VAAEVLEAVAAAAQVDLEHLQDFLLLLKPMQLQ